MTVLGLDASMVCIGWTLLSDDGSYIDCGYLKLNEEKNIYKKLDIFEKFIDSKLVGLENLKISMEQALLMFRTKSSMAGVIAKLQEINGMYRAVLYSKLKIETSTINPLTARSLCGLHIPRKTNTKEFVLAHVQSLNQVPNEKWTYSKKGKSRPTNYDIADSVIIALASIAQMKNAAK